MVEVQRVSSSGGPIAVTGLDYRGSICGLSLTLKLPSQARGKWGMNFRLAGGPSSINDFSTLLNPGVSMTSSGCTVGKGAPSKCTAEIVAPEGYALTPAFKKNAAIMDFFTSDLKLIDQWRKNGSLSPANALSFEMTATFKRCRPNKYPVSPGAITDRTWFGRTSYNLFDNKQRGTFLQTYRAYRLANVSGADWQVSVGKALTAGSKTHLAVMVLREADYLKWSNDCKKTKSCAPPFTRAIRGTSCQGLKCNGRVRHLGGRTGVYRLIVAYPEVCSVDNPACYTLNKPQTLSTAFAKELVSVAVQPKEWVLPPLGQSKMAKSADIYATASTAAASQSSFVDGNNIGDIDEMTGQLVPLLGVEAFSGVAGSSISS